jgi:DMSO/TMAO reductase YedYZ molybdopterin-dependent catalytic subunit
MAGTLVSSRTSSEAVRSRRTFLRQLSAGLAVCHVPAGDISQFDFSLLDDRLTPTQLFFIRNHTTTPSLSPHDWRLTIGGEVESPYSINFQELVSYAARTITCTIECAENPSDSGMVSTAEWRGVQLATLLERAKPKAAFVRLRGADADFARIIPMEKALHPDSLVVYRMNGAELSVAHGFPARVLIPGWYGMASVKWVEAVDVIGTANNADHIAAGGKPVTAMLVKSAFARPLEGAVIFGRRFVVRGAAWAGEQRVVIVELSADGGRSWSTATLLDAAQPYTWVRWQSAWKIPSAGDYDLIVRAVDDAGRTQPAEPTGACENGQNSWQRVKVTVSWSR